jgi:hypothetical protein
MDLAGCGGSAVRLRVPFPKLRAPDVKAGRMTTAIPSWLKQAGNGPLAAPFDEENCGIWQGIAGHIPIDLGRQSTIV